MTLAAYLDARKGTLTLTAMAAALNTSAGRLSQIKGGEKCSATLALAIEQFTDGAVNAGELSDDVAKVRAAA